MSIRLTRLSLTTSSALSPVYTIQPVVKPVVKPDTGCQSRLTTGLTAGWMFVYTIQPGCITFDNRLYRVNGVLQMSILLGRIAVLLVRRCPVSDRLAKRLSKKKFCFIRINWTAPKWKIFA